MHGLPATPSISSMNTPKDGMPTKCNLKVSFAASRVALNAELSPITVTL